MAVLYANNASTTLASGITNVATTLSVAAGKGALFPTIVAPDFCYCTLVDAANNIEIVKVTGRSGDSFTVVRAQESTTARAYLLGDKFELRTTAAGLANKLDKDTGGTLAGKLVTVASTTTTAGLNAPHGVAPTSPVNGDIWTTTAGLLARINSATLTFSTTSGTETYTNKTIDTAGTNTIKVNGNTLAASAGTATITFFNTSDTVVGRATTDTMTNKTLTTPTITGGTSSGAAISTPTITSATIDAGSSVLDTGSLTATSPGFRGIPQNLQASGYTLALTDVGKHIDITSGNITIPANGAVAFPIGSSIAIFNGTSGAITVSITTDTLRQAGTANTGTRNLTQYGLATILKVSSTTWVISGSGLS